MTRTVGEGSEQVAKVLKLQWKIKKCSAFIRIAWKVFVLQDYEVLNGLSPKKWKKQNFLDFRNSKL